MEATLIITKIIGTVYLTIGLGLLFNREYYSKAIIKLLDTRLYAFFSGMLALMCGILIFLYSNRDFGKIIK